MRLWNARLDPAGKGAAQSFTLVLRRPSALRCMFLPPTEVALAEAYLRDDFDVIYMSGSAEAFVVGRLGIIQVLLGLGALPMNALLCEAEAHAAGEASSGSSPSQ